MGEGFWSKKMVWSAISRALRPPSRVRMTGAEEHVSSMSVRRRGQWMKGLFYCVS